MLARATIFFALALFLFACSDDNTSSNVTTAKKANYSNNDAQVNYRNYCISVFDAVGRKENVDFRKCLLTNGVMFEVGGDFNLIGNFGGEANIIVGGTTKGTGKKISTAGILITSNLDLHAEEIIFDGAIVVKDHAVIETNELSYTKGTFFFGNAVWIINGEEFHVTKDHMLAPVEQHVSNI